MTDEKTGSELVTVNTPAGERHLKRLAPADWVKLGNTLRASRKAQLRAELAAAKASADDTKRSLDEFDRRPVKYRDVEAFINTMEGQYAAILYSLQKDNPAAGEAEFNELAVPPQDWLEVTGHLLNVPIVVTRVGPDGPLPETGESPQSPPTIGTGTPTPAESAST